MNPEGACRFSFLVLVLLLACAAASQEPVIDARVVGVTDGDTIQVLTANNRLIGVRLAFVDAPEKGQAFGNVSKRAMSELVFGHTVALRLYAAARYGRLVAQVFVDGTDAGLELLKQGLAWAYEPYLPEAPQDVQVAYRQGADQARSSRLGLWQDANPEPPWEFRQNLRVVRVNSGAPKDSSSRLSCALMLGCDTCSTSLADRRLPSLATGHK
jgi:endonuclease YncB( thermonuclease family)